MRASTNFTEKTSVIAAKKDVTPTAVENKNMNIITLTTENEYQKLLTEAADKIVVVEFHAPWCGPCKLVKPEVEKIAQNYGEKILIIQVDIDDFEEFAISMEVTTTPTFVILKNKHKLEQFFTSKSEIIWEKVARAFGGLSELEVQLVVPRYVERGSSAIMKCMHNVRPEILFKVTWLKVDTGKFFEFINGRNPPFRNFSVLGGEIDWENSNQTQVTLRDVDFDLSGQFYCEVSTDTPIFTKASGDELLSVFLPQTAPPTIKFRKRSPFAIGERLLALCNTTRARPAPHITWLINGKKVEEKFVRTHHVYSLTGKSHRRTQQQQHQQQLQQEYYQHQHQHQHSQYHQQYQIPHLPDRYDKSLRWSGRPGDDFAVHLSQYKEGYYHPASVYNNPFSSLTNIHDINDIHEVQHRSYENKHDVKKHLETKKHHKSSTHKYRRHINENALGIIRTTLNNGGFGPEPKKLNHEHNRVSNHGPMNQLVAGHQGPLSHPGGGRGVAQAAAAVIAAAEQEKGNKDAEKGMFSISQLNIELSEQHVDTTGRMEITCLATIPTAVGQGEQFADYKTFSVKVDIERPEISYASTAVPNIGMAALGNGHVPSAATATKAIVEMHMIYICLQIGSAALWLSRFYLIKY